MWCDTKNNRKEVKQIIELFSTNTQLSLCQRQVKFKKSIISCESIRTRQISNLKFWSTMKKPLFSEKHVAKRITLAHENINRN